MSEEGKLFTAMQIEILNSKALQHFQAEIESLKTAVRDLKTHGDNLTVHINELYTDLDEVKTRLAHRTSPE